jgi:hypothetical protein
VLNQSVTEQPFGPRLRRERERRQIALTSISASTKISVAFFEALERDDLSRWPSGIFRRAFIRAYAAGIGLDPETVTREFLERFPDPSELLPPVAAGSIPVPAGVSSGSDGADGAPMRLTFADAGAAPKPPRALTDTHRRWAAAACDALVVLLVAAAAFAASGQFWLPFGVSALAYYWGGIVLLGNTPGVYLWAPAASGADARSTVTAYRSAIVKGASAFLVRFNGAASAPGQRTTLGSEPRASGS